MRSAWIATVTFSRFAGIECSASFGGFAGSPDVRIGTTLSSGPWPIELGRFTMSLFVFPSTYLLSSQGSVVLGASALRVKDGDRLTEARRLSEPYVLADDGLERLVCEVLPKLGYCLGCMAGAVSDDPGDAQLNAEPVRTVSTVCRSCAKPLSAMACASTVRIASPHALRAFLARVLSRDHVVLVLARATRFVGPCLTG